MDEEFSDLVKALKANGLTIPDRVSDLAGLVIAVESNGPAGYRPDDDEADADGNGNPDDDPFGGQSTSPSSALALSTVDASGRRVRRPTRRELACVAEQAALAKKYSTKPT